MDEKTLVEILEECTPVDIAKYINYVSAPQAGAIATFSGTTRDTFDGKIVQELRYEAYVPMAIRCIKALCSSCRSKWNIHSIAVAHRLGPVRVAETSIFIAVSSVHRNDALESCRFLIDEIKASVPIWKKEVYANGEVWKENSEFMERRLELGKSDEGRLEGKVENQVHNGHSCCKAKVKVYDSPHLQVLVGKRTRKRLDAKEIVQLLQRFEAPMGTKAYIEQSAPFPQDGKQGWWTGGFGYGLWIGILVALGFTVIPVPSLTWKNNFAVSGKSATKDDSRRVASMLFPSLNPMLKRKKDHGRAEALLIAAYGKGLKMDPTLINSSNQI